MSLGNVLIIAVAGSILALSVALWKSLWIFKQAVEDEKLKKIGRHVASGAMAFLSREFRVLVPVVLIIAVLLAIANSGYLRLQAFSFLVGAACSFPAYV